MNRRDIQKEIQKTLIQDEQNEIIQFSAMHSLDNVFHQFHTTINGLNEKKCRKES